MCPSFPPNAPALTLILPVTSVSTADMTFVPRCTTRTSLRLSRRSSPRYGSEMPHLLHALTSVALRSPRDSLRCSKHLKPHSRCLGSPYTISPITSSRPYGVYRQFCPSNSVLDVPAEGNRETSNKALNAINQLHLVPFLMSFLSSRHRLPLSTVASAGSVLFLKAVTVRPPMDHPNSALFVCLDG